MHAVKDTKIDIVAFDTKETNLIDTIWTERPIQAPSKVQFLSEKYTGRKVAEKLHKLREEIQKKKAHAIILTALDDIAWLFNIRGNDVEFNPVVYVVSTCCFFFLENDPCSFSC